MVARLGIAALLVVFSWRWIVAQETKPDESRARKFRQQLMQDTIAGFRMPDIGNAPTKFVARPLLRYSDPTRNVTGTNSLLDGGVWRLGESGRPLALVTLEIYGKSEEGAAVLSYEFLAMVDDRISLSHKQNETVNWDYIGKDALVMRPLPDSPPPATNPAGRLVQMRQLARKFRVHETILKDKIECRLLSQPIDRYRDGDRIVDGAIFAFANGTNPEVGVLLECTAERWLYGVIRLSSAETRVELDGRDVASFPHGDFRFTPNGNYFSVLHPVRLEK